MANRKIIYNFLFLGLITLVTLGSCKKKEAVNPYENIEPIENTNPNIVTIPDNNFAWLQAKVFKPTCANSGCHDGTFEPNFSTISSSYNTIVNHSPISNDVNNSYNYRVNPGDASTSLMFGRMTTLFPNTSGMMPAALDPGSDWLANSDFYLSKIEEWINDGAKDMYGNDAPSSSADFPPQVTGLIVFPQGNTTTPYQRDPDAIEITPILVDASSIDVWIYVTDDNTSPSTMTSNQLKASQDITDFTGAITSNFTVNSPLSAMDFFDTPVQYLHKATLDLSGYSSGDTFFLRNILDDGEQISLTELPNAGSNAVITSFFVIKIQ